MKKEMLKVIIAHNETLLEWVTNNDLSLNPTPNEARELLHEIKGKYVMFVEGLVTKTMYPRLRVDMDKKLSDFKFNTECPSNWNEMYQNLTVIGLTYEG